MYKPIILIFKEGKDFSSVGIKKFGIRQIIVVAVSIAFSIGGQIIPKLTIGETINYGFIPAIVLSGLMFSIYHLGYPGFRIHKQTY